MEARQLAVLKNRRDQQDGIGAHGASAHHLHRVHNEVLTEDRDLDGGVHRLQVIEIASEKFRLGEHRNRRCAVGRVSARQRNRVIVTLQKSAGRRALLAFGDQGHTPSA